MAYVYKGANHEVDPEPAPRAKTGAFDPDKCGTYAGYKQHQNYGIPSCDICKEAQAEYSRNRPSKRTPRKNRTLQKTVKTPIPCGSHAAYKRHKRAGQPVDDACREAYNAHMRAYRPATRILRPCGTIAAYKRHIAHGEQPCEQCAHVNSAQPNQENQAA